MSPSPSMRVDLAVLAEPGLEGRATAVVHVHVDERPVAAPIAISLALDCSSSMRGAPLEAAKRAARDLVTLLDDDDRFALVVFDRSAATVVPPTRVADARDDALARIDGIEAGFGTNLGLAAERALAHARAMGPCGRALLFTDGYPYFGLLQPSQLASAVGTAARLTPLSVVAFGTEVNHDVSHALASATTGRTLHLPSAADPRLAIATELGGYRAAALLDVQVELTLAEGVRVVAVHHRGPHGTTREGLHARLAPAGYGEPTRFVCELEGPLDGLGHVVVRARNLAGEALPEFSAPLPRRGEAVDRRRDAVLARTATAMHELLRPSIPLLTVSKADRAGLAMTQLGRLADEWGLALDARVRAASHWHARLVEAERRVPAPDTRDYLVIADGIERQYEARLDHAGEHGLHEAFRTDAQREGEEWFAELARGRLRLN